MKFKRFCFVAAAFSAFAVPASAAFSDDEPLCAVSAAAEWPDYSYVGYRAGEAPLPFVPVRAYVEATEGDATGLIQQAIDYVSALQPDGNGFRGAVLLGPGTFQVAGGLNIATSGVVLRGSGLQTEIVGTGDDRTTLIRLAGRSDRRLEKTFSLTQPVAAGSRQIIVGGHPFRSGDRLLVNRLCTQAWIDEMDMNDFGGESIYIGWKPGDASQGRPGDVDIHWDRSVVAVWGDTLLLDAPLTCAIRPDEGTVQRYEWPGRLSGCGVENLRLTSAYKVSNAKDENHRWMAVEMDNIENAWVRQVEFRHFAGSAVFMSDRSRCITVADSRSLEPVSEWGGERRNAFFTMGGQCLVIRCSSEEGMHDFSVGRNAPGPNAFVSCAAIRPLAFSGTIGSWATGVLFDGFVSEEGALCFSNRGQDAMGAGYTAANSVMWNCRAARVAGCKTPTADNWAYGVKAGAVEGDIDWQGVGQAVVPQSLYRTLFLARGLEEDTLTFEERFAADVPSDLMASVWKSASVPADATVPAAAPKMHLENGLLVRDGRLLTGSRQGITWWNGSLKERYTYSAGPCLTRYAPGRVGTGFTDDLDSLTDRMVARHVLTVDHHYGLWYDRRRDDHERVRRMDACVWPPFYEQPFARSGKESAWDGLSKYDLTDWNVWYWNRLKKYADLADKKGLVLYHQNYFQHNIIEAGAHWADSPWRSANNINGTGFPEPVPYANDKRIYMADHFYDVTHPVRRELHRNYIRKCLEAFADNASVIQFVSEEYTGPLHFMQFWLDVIAEWEAETGRRPLIALSCTKDVQDSILADPQRARTVDVIDIKYWHPNADGSYYAPPGGVSLAPRQYARQRGEHYNVKGSGTARGADNCLYETVSDLRSRFPEKAVIYSAGQADAWVLFMAGASLVNLPAGVPAAFLEAASEMEPVLGGAHWVRGCRGVGYVAYGQGGTLSVDLTGDRAVYTAQWLDRRSGLPVGEPKQVKGGRVVSLKGNGILWLHK